jgi:uncharacterized protein (TIGR00645 family)
MEPVGGRVIQAAVILSRWLMAPLLVGLACCLVLIICRFFTDLFALTLQLPTQHFHDLIVGVLNLVDLVLIANLVLIVLFSTYENFIQKINATGTLSAPDGLRQVDFNALKQRLLASIVGIAAVDALAWYLDLDKYADTSKLGWAVGFPLMFVVAMLMLAVADWLGRRSE